MDELLCDHFALTPDPVVAARDDGTPGGPRILRANPALGAAIGAPPDALRDTGLGDLWDEETARAIAAALSAAPRDARTDTLIEGRLRAARGPGAWVSIALTVLPQGRDGARPILAALRDISALKAREKAAEEALRRQKAARRAQAATLAALVAARERLVTAMDAYPDPFVLYDRDWILVSCNAAYRRQMSADPGLIRPGMSYVEVMHCAFDAGKIPEPEVGRDAFITEMMESTRAGEQIRDLHLGGEVWHRVIRTVTASGDIVILRIDITELLRQRRTTQEAQDRLTSALDAYPDPFVIYDNDWVLVTCNTAYRRHMAGGSGDIRPGMTFAEVMHCALDAGKVPEPEQGRAAFIADWMTSARAGDQVRDFHFGGDVHHRIIRTVTPNDDLVIIRSDISELVRQRRSAQQAQERLAAAMDAYPDPFVIYDSDLRLVTCNTAYRRHMSRDPGAIRPGMHYGEVLPLAIENGVAPEPAIGREAHIARMAEKLRAGPSAEDMELPTGIHHRLLRNRAENGDFVILRMDVTELVHQRRSAQAAEIRLMAAMNAYPDPFVIYDSDLRLVTCNTAYRRHMSRDPEAIRPGMTFREVLDLAIANDAIADPPEGREAFVAALWERFREGCSVEDVEAPGDVHHRLLRNLAENGDFVILRMDVTELVRQRRSAQAAEIRLLAAMNAYPDPFVIWGPDLRLVTCNSAYRRHVAADPEAIRPGMPFAEVLDLAIAKGTLKEPPEGRTAFTERIVAKFGEGSLVEDEEAPGDLHHRLLRNVAENGDFVVLRMDVTELVRQRRSAEAAQARLLSALDAYPAPFSIYDRENRLVVCNAAYRRSVADDPDLIRPGMDLMEIQRLSLRRGFVLDARGREEAWLADIMRQAADTTPQFDMALANGVHHRVLRSRAENGDLILVRIDMTEVVAQQRVLEENARSLEEANAEITKKAFNDELTGLGNRRYLADRFDDLRQRRAMEGGELTALHMDLDRFKAINDTIGHAAGDHVLRTVAGRMLALVRRDELVARIGGDEFVILFREETASDRAFALGDALVEAMAAPVLFEGRECRFGASVGIARTPVSPPADLLINSDIALYKAKRAGRGQVSVFDVDDVVEMRTRKALADDIERALEQSEFVPFFQPQIDAVTGAVVGVEALARWAHPARGILAPDAFLAMAEELDVVARIDRMIFEKALDGCRETFAAWGAYPSLAFNVSSKRVETGGFDDIARSIDAYPGEIAFELLETIFLEEESAGFHVKLDQLREMGITIEVDDFGSGRASVVALQRIAPDRLKIDRRLVRPMTQGENASRLVRSIIEIGNALDIGVTAEGVETEDHARLLAEMGVERLQGYFFARPMGLEALGAYLAATAPIAAPAGRDPAPWPIARGRR
ncbi:MAG: EAL domain-containing protein [Roseicyclus sp.]